MTHSTIDIDGADNCCLQPADSISIERADWASLPRAKPDERLTHGLPPEAFFGICAEEFDDEFMESLRVIRRGDNRTETHE